MKMDEHETFLVDLPFKGVIFHGYVSVPEGIHGE